MTSLSSEVRADLTEVKPTLNLDTFEISLNDQLNLGSLGLSIGSLYTGERKGATVEKLAVKCMINLDVAKDILDATTQLVIRFCSNPRIT